MSKDFGYYDEARTAAKEAARNYFDEICEKFIDSGDTPLDLLDYSDADAFHHETHVDQEYSLTQAAELLEELSDYEETDDGLWEGQKPREAICTQAAYTYGSAVLAIFRNIMENINDDDTLAKLWDEYNGVEDRVQEEWDEAQLAWDEQQEENRIALSEKEQELPEDQRTEYEAEDFVEPFDVDNETERRKDELVQNMRNRIDQLIEEF